MILVADKVTSLPTVSRKTILQGVILIALTLIAYAPAMTGSFIWDDDDYVTANANLRTPAGLYDIWFKPHTTPQYYPLVHTSFWIEYQIWDTSAPGYHVVNILLHAVGALLAFGDCSNVWISLRHSSPLAFSAIHPLQAESVAWITERKNVLSGVFYFASALGFVAWASRPRDKNSGETPKPRQNWMSTQAPYVLALVCFMLRDAQQNSRLLPARIARTFPLVEKRPHHRAAMVRASANVRRRPRAGDVRLRILEVEHVQAVGREWNLSHVDRILIAGRAVWFYVSKFCLPIGQSFIYAKWTIDPHVAWQWAFPISVVVSLAALFAMRDRWGRGPLVAALIFVGTLVPALGFFNIYPMRYSFVADHFQYHACVALCVLLAIGRLQRLLGRHAYWPLAILLVLTMSRSYTLADPLRLWQDAAAKNPNSWMVHLNLARTLEDRQRPEEAQAEFAQQLTLAPELPDTHWNWGVNLARRGKLEEALTEYDKAIANDPNFAPAYYARGRVFVQQQKPDQAAVQFARAIELGRGPEQRTYRAAAHAELAELFKQQQLFDQAITHYRAAISDDPMFAKARVNLAALLAMKGETEEATKQFDQAVQIDPSLETYRAAVLKPPPIH